MSWSQLILLEEESIYSKLIWSLTMIYPTTWKSIFIGSEGLEESEGKEWPLALLLKGMPARYR